ncbi:hypothetical protein ACRALDRAFT_1079671 [Sodiomyces alcalophilus JCM 7366]|uniref:uncharacterized protein n=1 Tax=Sodiomyces alcalophilus JCM 7366 TaxID=591952 RepID=UPI0039B66EEF
MVSDEHYELCLPILQDASLEDEDKTDRLEEVLRKETALRDSSLEHAILDALWRYRDGGNSAASPPPIRQTILRRPSPASWRGNGTPLSGSPRLGVSPLAPHGFFPSSLTRNKTSTVSPFSSPRPSPRLAFATPAIPHSPNLNAYEFAHDTTPSQEVFGDYQTENVEWLVADDAVSITSSVGTSSGLNAAAPEFSSLSSQQTDMSPYDMLRSILGPARTDEEIESALAVHGYDLSATLVAIMENHMSNTSYAVNAKAEETKSVVIGKSMTSDGRPTTPANQQRLGVICKFYLSTGQCLRSDCRFSHDLSNHLCKYWIMGNCLAGDTCIFSHDPAQLVNKLSVDGAQTPPSKQQVNIQLSDYNSFPALQPGTPDQVPHYAGAARYRGMTPPPGLRQFHTNDSPRPRSRPGSRQQQARDTSGGAPPLDDAEAFPSLGSAVAKQGKKQHTKRAGHGSKDNTTAAPSSLADIVKMSPSPGPTPTRQDIKKTARNGSTAVARHGENSAAAQAIPSPKHIPWLETGERANKSYLKARQEAIKHGGLRNKFLQSAAQAWNRNDARAAKALSLRGQSENDLMRKAHREAARELYEERNKGNSTSSEIYVDLHGLHPDEAVEYLERVLLDNSKEIRPIYAITGTGHHSKNGKDKVGRAIRNFLNEWSYAYREFSVPGDRNNMGGILGIDARSYDKSLARGGGASLAEAKEEEDILSQGVEIGDGKVRLLVRDPPKGPSAKR